MPNNAKEKSTVVALLLFVFFAPLGLHRFYARKYITASIILGANIVAGILFSQFIGAIIGFLTKYVSYLGAERLFAGDSPFNGGTILLLIIPVLWWIGFAVWYFIDLFKIATERFFIEP